MCPPHRGKTLSRAGPSCSYGWQRVPQKQWGKESGTYVCGRIALLSWCVAQIAQMAEHWYGLPEAVGLIPGLGL